MSAPNKKAGFSLIEALLVACFLIILVLMVIPYFMMPIESSRATEVTLCWSRFKRDFYGQDLTVKHNHLAQEANEKALKRFTVKLVCEKPNPIQPRKKGESCWEAVFHLRKPTQAIRYYLVTSHNLTELICVPLNKRGNTFCRNQTAKENQTPISFQGKEAYLLYH